MRKFLIVANAFSGKGEYKYLLDKIFETIESKGYSGEYVLTNPHLKEELGARLSTSTFTDVVALGGDGTVNLAVNALPDFSIPLSIVANGTGNDYVKSLNFKEDHESQLDTMINGRISQIDLGVCNGRYFLNGMGMGFDGKVVEKMEEKGKRYSGHLAYLAVVLSLLTKYREQTFEFKVDGKERRESLFMFTTTIGKVFGGGFITNPNAIVDDGFLDLFLLKKTSYLRRFVALSKVKKGTHQQMREIEMLKAKEVEVGYHPDIVAHMDGEFIGKPPYSIKVAPGMLNIRVP